MAKCRCRSKAHGHGDVCGCPTVGTRDFCHQCQQKIMLDRNIQAEPNLTRTGGAPTVEQEKAKKG
jgi:hypothetical protein